MGGRHKLDKLKLGEYDRRRKLSDDQKEHIKKLYETGMYSQRQLAAQFGVSRRLIVFIVRPDAAKRAKQRIKEHWKDYQRSREERTEAARKVRSYKKQLYLEGKIGGDNL